MKTSIILSIIITLSFLSSSAQNIRKNPHEINRGTYFLDELRPPIELANDTTFDVSFYHLELEIAIDSSYIHGKVSYLVHSSIANLNSLILDLDEVFIVDSISTPALSFDFEDSKLKINFRESYNEGDAISFTVYYHGQPELAEELKGLRYETHDGGQPIIASLATPYLAHYWWPCKDGVKDKADSTFIDIRIKDTIIDNIPLIALSNGLLDTIVTDGKNKVFKWKHHYPIVPYYIMVAISNYKHFEQVFEGDNYSFPIDYYVFDSHLSSAQDGLAELTDVMQFFTNTFGPYPFRKEKYGMTQLGFFGGIENQTNSIVRQMSPSWFGVSVHELAHQWFANMITCETWNHGWLNEGFASYSEALYIEYSEGFIAYQNDMRSFEFYQDGTLYLEDVSDPFNVFRSIIYNKGAYVLHMLRGVMGDDDFFASIYNYAKHKDFQYQHSTTQDFQKICEEVSGINLEYFFSQWIYDERYPIYNYNYSTDQIQGRMELTIHQVQSMNGWRSVFEMPMEVELVFEDFTDTILVVMNNMEHQNFIFNIDQEVINVSLDPNKWILKELEFDPLIKVENMEMEGVSFKMTPNPTSEDIKIECLNFEGEATITLIDAEGKKRQESVVFFKHNQLTFLELIQIEAGTYFVVIRSKEGVHVENIVVLD